MQNAICYTNAYITRTCKIQVLYVFHVFKNKKKQYTTMATRFFFLNRFCESLSEDVPIYTDDR